MQSHLSIIASETKQYLPSSLFRRAHSYEKRMYTVCDPDGGIAPGTPFENIPDTWVWPVCVASKDQFVKVRGSLEAGTA